MTKRRMSERVYGANARIVLEHCWSDADAICLSFCLSVPTDAIIYEKCDLKTNTISKTKMQTLQRGGKHVLAWPAEAHTKKSDGLARRVVVWWPRTSGGYVAMGFANGSFVRVHVFVSRRRL